ncbi:hypothetical protein Tco_0992682 [Tanacetum coccineum]|uniref:Uncharacterized protein n=1 Tax=Tanacetum coccineum TaxID=301880 RepID=A0ABQ5F2S9_9ASTR
MNGSRQEQTQQGISYEVSVIAEGVEELKTKVKIKGEKKEALLTLRPKPEHQSDTQVITVKMEILLEPTSNKLLVGELHYLLDKVVSVGTAPGPNSSDHNVNTITNGDGMPRMRTFRETIFPE